MPNMDYCRFQNTFYDLQECYKHMDDTDLSSSEKNFRRKIIELSSAIVNEYIDELDEPFERGDFDNEC